MKRNVDLAQISDGRLYDVHDMAKLGCRECAGCSACCRGMGSSILLDPMDVYRLEQKLHKSFEELLQDHVELNVVDGVILPNLKLVGAQEVCSFLNEEGRCSIHDSRPGICRLFPLGRYYENGDYKYFLQVKECQIQNRTKVKISKWIDVADYNRYKKYILRWHFFLNRAEELIQEASDDDFARQLCMLILQAFYRKTYDVTEDFYEQFYARMKVVEDALG